MFAGPGNERAPSSPPRTAARTRRTIRSSPRPASAAPTSGSSTPTTSAPTLGGTPLTILTLFADTPRALAVTPGRRHGLRGGVPLRQPDHDASTRRWSRTAARPPAASRARHQRRRRRRGRRPGSSSRLRRQPTGSTSIGRDLGRPGRSFSCPTRTCSPSTRTPNPPAQLGGAAGSTGRRHHPVQHGGQPGERQGLRHRTPTRATTSASRGRAPSPGHSLRGHIAESRITVLDPGGRRRAAPPQQAHRLRRLLRRDPEPPRTPRASRSRTEHGGHAATAERSTSRRSAPARSASSTPRARGRHVRAERRQPDRGHRRRPDRPRARRGAATASTCSPASTTHLGRRHGSGGTRSGTSPMYNPEPAERDRTGAASSTTRRSPRATATRPARAATSSATSTAWRGTSATRTAIVQPDPGAVRVRSSRRRR